MFWLLVIDERKWTPSFNRHNDKKTQYIYLIPKKLNSNKKCLQLSLFRGSYHPVLFRFLLLLSQDTAVGNETGVMQVNFLRYSEQKTFSKYFGLYIPKIKIKLCIAR